MEIQGAQLNSELSGKQTFLEVHVLPIILYADWHIFVHILRKTM